MDDISDNKKDLSSTLEELGELFRQAFESAEQDQEAYWNSLSTEDQLKAFCAVVRRIVRGELQDKGSYRYVLYNTFGFGLEAYGQAQMAGYLELHNSIFESDEIDTLLQNFCKQYGIEDSEEKIKNFFQNYY